MQGLDRTRRDVCLATELDDTGVQIMLERAVAYDTLVIAAGSQTHDFGTPGAAQFALSLDTPERDIKVAIIEAAPRILPALPERLSEATQRLLENIRVDILTGERVTEVRADGVRTSGGRHVQAGIKAPDLLAGLDGLESNRSNQLLLKQTLQTTRDPEVFAFGDCSSCAWPGYEARVPPLAQAAHLAKSIIKHIQGKSLNDWVYRDFGSLVSLGQHGTVGSLMGALTRGSLMLEGYFARLMYLSLYKMHEYTLHGFAKVFFDSVARLIVRQTEPHVKLH
jgi:NADH dehydrogenase